MVETPGGMDDSVIKTEVCMYSGVNKFVSDITYV